MTETTIALIGAIMMAVILFFNVTKKIPIMTTYIVFPLLTLIILGYKPAEISEIIQSQVYSSMTSTGLLLLFSVPFFSILSEAGVFDVMICKVIKMAKGNVFIILFATVVIATIGQLDGSLVTTYVITIPPLVALYERMKMDKRWLLFLTALVTVGFYPAWGPNLLLTASIAKVDPFELMYGLVPLMCMVYAGIAILCIVYGLQHRKMYGKIAVEEREEVAMQENPRARPKLLGFNIVLLVATIVALLVSGLPSYVVFMFAFSIAMAVNYPNSSDFSYIIKKVSHTFVNPLLLIASINLCVGMLTKTGIVTGWANAILSVIPMGMAKYAFLLVGLLTVPICQIMPYQVITALLPFLLALADGCRIPAIVAVIPFCNVLVFGTCCSRFVAQTHLGMGLITTKENTEQYTDTYIKWAFPQAFVFSVIVLLIWTVTSGAVKI